MESRQDDEVLPSGSDEDEGNTSKKNVDLLSNGGKDRVSRILRNTSERKRKEKIKMYITQLKEMIPNDYLPSNRKPASSNAVLERAVAYMKHLKDQADMFFLNNGSEAQRVEIARLKDELLIATNERQKYEAMIQQSVAVTSKMLDNGRSEPNKVNAVDQPQSFPPASDDSSSSGNPFLAASDTAGKIPGQGLIITQSGQAYYVNEQGIPVAQGMAPAHLHPDNIMPKHTSAGLSQPASSILPNSIPLASIAASTTASAVSGQQTAGPAVPNGLVALPGHTGQLPSAIILPNGQMIPVVTSNSAQNPPANGVLSSISSSRTELVSDIATVPSTSIVSTIPSTADLTCTTSNHPGIMLISGQQPATSGMVMNPGAVIPSIDTTAQFGRKIMPKPSLFNQMPQPMMASITLAPIPLPACSISIAPSAFLPDNEVGKKKRSRKKKAKEGEKLTAKDILATATASLFSPQKNVCTKEKPSEQPSVEMEMCNKPAGPVADPALQLLSVPPHPLNGVRARRTRKRKNREEKLAASGLSENRPKSKKGNSVKTDALETHAEVSPMELHTEPLPATDTDSPQAIEFDPNDLDNILDQVENIEGTLGADAEDENGVSKGTADSKTATDYQVVGGDEEIGHVFTTSSIEAKPLAYDIERVTPVSQSISYAASDSYLIGSLAKTSEQPIDHRQTVQHSAAVVEQPIDHRLHSQKTGSVAVLPSVLATSQPIDHRQSVQRNAAMTERPIDHKKTVQHNSVITERSIDHKLLVQPNTTIPEQPIGHRQNIQPNATIMEQPIDHRQNVEHNATITEQPMDHRQHMQRNPSIAEQPIDHRQSVQYNANITERSINHRQNVQHNATITEQPVDHRQRLQHNANITAQPVDHRQQVQKVDTFAAQSNEHSPQTPKSKNSMEQSNLISQKPDYYADLSVNHKSSVLISEPSTAQPIDHRQPSRIPEASLGPPVNQHHLGNNTNTDQPVDYRRPLPKPYAITSTHDQQMFGGGSTHSQQQSHPQAAQAFSNADLISSPNSLQHGFKTHSNQMKNREQMPVDHSGEVHGPNGASRQDVFAKSNEKLVSSLASPPSTSNEVEAQKPHRNQTQSAQIKFRKKGATQSTAMTTHIQNPSSPFGVQAIKSNATTAPAWSPAKDLETSSKSQPNSQHSSHYSVHQPYSSSSFQPTPSNPASNVQSNPTQTYNQTPKSLQSSQTFCDGLYQYPQFSPFANHMTSATQLGQTKPMLSDQSNDSTSQSSSMFHQFSGNNSNYMVSQHNDQPSWPTAPSAIHNQPTPSPYDRKRSSEQGALPGHTNDPSFNLAQQKKGKVTDLTHENKQQVEARDQHRNQSHNSAFSTQRDLSTHGYDRQREDMYSSTLISSKQLAAQTSGAQDFSIHNSSPSKHNMFSTESLLHKSHGGSEEIASPRSLSQYNPYQPPLSHNTHSPHLTGTASADKGKVFIPSHANESSFEMNLFAPSSRTLASLPAPMTSSHRLPYNDTPFTFSLTSTSAAAVVQAPASYSKAPEAQHSFIFPQAPPRMTLDAMKASDRSDAGSRSSSSSNEARPHSVLHHTAYPANFGMNLVNTHQRKPELQNAATIAQQPPPPLVKSKRTKSRQGESPKPSLPYNFPQPYAMPQFSSAKGSDASQPYIFNPQPIYNKQAGSLGIAFQHPGFPAFPPRVAHEFNSQPSQANQSSSFNINNIFKEAAPVDAFKLGGSTNHGSMYAQQHPHLYHNPMSINNILSGAPVFDTNRTAPSVAAFSSPHPNFPGFHNPFDFNVSGQS